MLRKILSPFLAVSALVVIMLLSFTATAFAAGAVAPDDGSWTDLLRPVYDAFHAGHYLAAGALAVVVAVALVKRYAGSGKFGSFMGGDVGGTLATLLASFAGAVAAAAGSGDGFSWAMMLTAGKVAALAAGGYAILKKLIIDPLQASTWYKTKAPALLKTIVGAVSWIFDKPAASAAEVTKAEAAGAAAVAADPAPGASKVVPPAEKF